MSEEIKVPTNEEFCDGLLESVRRTDQSGWRHGVDREEIFFRESDQTYWSVGYRVSTDGETHGLRDGDYTIYQVRRITVEMIDYEKV